MKTMISLMLLGALANTSAYAQHPQVRCSQFHHNDDGSWSALVPMKISGPKGSFKLIPGLEFRPGVALMGADLGTVLDVRCGIPGGDR